MDRIPDAALYEKRRDSAVAAIAFLGFLSLQFDFGHCINPSRERPYFFQGRLMAMIPFALLYIYGLQRPKWQRRLVANRRRGGAAATISSSVRENLRSWTVCSRMERAGAPRHRLQNPKSGKRTHQGFRSATRRRLFHRALDSKSARWRS